MLGKLFKHEFKATYKLLLFSYLSEILLILFFWVAKLIDLDFITLSSFGIACLGAGGVSIITFIFVGTRYNSSMFKSQGYLTNTLPVKSNHLIFTKAIVSICYIVASTIFIAVSLGVLIYIMSDGLIIDYLEMIGLTMTPEIWRVLIFTIVSSAIGSIYLISILYVSVTLGNIAVFQKLGRASGFIIFIIMYIVTNILQNIALILIPLGINFADDKPLFVFENMFNTIFLPSQSYYSDTTAAVGIGGLVFSICCTVAFFWLTSYLVNKKINIK